MYTSDTDEHEQYKTVSGKYELGATYCEPDHGPSDVVQILTHGVGFDRRSVREPLSLGRPN